MSRVIDAVLRLRDEFTQPLSKSIGLMTSASKAGDRTRKAIEKYGNGIAKTGMQLTTAITLPVMAAGTACVKTAASFESGMAQVQATMGITKDATTKLNGEVVNTMDALSRFARDLGKDTVFSASEAAAAMNNMAMAGYNAQEIYDTLPTVLSLAAAGSLDLDYATQLVANGMAVMGDKCESAQQMADMMAVTASNAYGSVADFGEGLLVAGGQAAVCGQNLVDTYTALGILGDNGIIGSEGGTALRNTLQNLYQPTDKAAKTLDALGIKTSDASGNLLGMQEVLQQLNGALSGLSEADKSTAMAEIFDTRTIAAASALLGNATDRWDDLRKTISGASDLYDGKGAAAGMADVLMGTTEGSIEELKGGLEELGISLGQVLVPYLTQAVAWAQNLVDKFNSLDDGTKETIVRFAIAAAAAGPLITGFGKMIVMGSKLLGVFANARGVLAAVSKAGGVLKFAIAALTSPIGLVVAACVAIAAVIAVVITHFDQFKAAAESASAKIAPQIESMKAAFTSFWNTVSPIITFISDLIANVLVGAFEGALSTVSIVIDGITNYISGIQTTISGVVNLISAIAHGDWAAAWDAFTDVIKGRIQAITGLIEGVVGIVTGLINAIAGAGEKTAEFVAKNSNSGASKGGGGRKIPGNATGTTNWSGGWTRVNEKGGEIMNLPSGTQIIPHDASRNTPLGGNITIAKLADSIVVREDTDIDRIATEIVRKLAAASNNRGGLTFSGSMA